jgi:hypothetical protein
MLARIMRWPQDQGAVSTSYSPAIAHAGAPRRSHAAVPAVTGCATGAPRCASATPVGMGGCRTPIGPILLRAAGTTMHGLGSVSNHSGLRQPALRSRGQSVVVRAAASSSSGGKRITQNEFTEKAWQVGATATYAVHSMVAGSRWLPGLKDLCPLRADDLCIGVTRGGGYALLCTVNRLALPHHLPPAFQPRNLCRAWVVGVHTVLSPATTCFPAWLLDPAPSPAALVPAALVARFTCLPGAAEHEPAPA